LKEIATSSQDYDFIISAGVPGGSSEPKQFRGGVFFEWCPNVEELAHRASVIVSRAGHTSIAKAVLAGKPLITIPIERQTEQVGNAQRVQRLGIGMMINQRELDPGSLLSAVRLCLNSSLEIEKKANNLRNVALQHDGAEAISRIVEELKAQEN
jgi:UDP:flavonoid glycosyltransferase YjiC (YdhE family)